MENLNNTRTGQNNQSNYLTNEESDFVRSDENSSQEELNLYDDTTQDEQTYNENNANNVSHALDFNPNENRDDIDENLDIEEEDDFDFENDEVEEDEDLSDDEEENLDNERQNRSYRSPSDDYENKIDQSFSGML